MKRTEFIKTLLLYCVIGCFAFSFGFAAGQKETSNVEIARDTGYKQSCVELSYALGMLSDNDYNSYLEVADKYDNEPNEKNLEELSKLVNRLLRDLPMWDVLDENSKDSSI